MTDIPHQLRDNPLLHSWVQTGDLPDFAAIKPEHFEPAYLFALDVAKQEINAITNNPAPASFDNTLLALERSSKLLSQIGSVFALLGGVMATPELQDLKEKLDPIGSRHDSWVAHNKALFERIDAVFSDMDGLTPLQRRLTSEMHESFIDSGAKLAPAVKARLADIDARDAELSAQFDKKWTDQVEQPTLLLSRAEDLAGLPQFVLDGAAEAAIESDNAGLFGFNATGPVMENFLTYSSRRDLRETLYHAWASRNDRDDEFDNKPVISEMLALAAESTAIMGYASPAQMYLKDNMIKTPENAEALLRASWGPAAVAYTKERALLQDVAAADGLNGTLQPWDWRYYAQKVRESKYGLDDAELKPYLSVDNVIKAAFATAEMLWGIKMQAVPNAKLYHADARLWNVCEADGSVIGKFIGDYFARPTKQQGAWMNDLRGQHGLDGGQTPIIYNVCNISKAAEGKPTLLSLEEAKTVFHEFGHALHGLLSNVLYPSLSGVNGPADYIELPSQLFEKFLLTDVIKRDYLRHAETNAPLPSDLADKIKASQNAFAGHEMLEFLTSAIVDLELYKLKDASTVGLRQFERDTLVAWGAPEGAYMRHRLPHFSHIFGGGYSASYHGYEQAAVLDSDAFDAFTEAGNPFDQTTAARLRKTIYSSGATLTPLDSYIAFRGRAPTITPLLLSRGFIPTPVPTDWNA